MNAWSFAWWFGTIPLYESATLRWLFAGFLCVVIAGAVVRLVSRRHMQDRYQVETARRTATMLVMMGLLGLWYWFVAYQQIPFLSARFWLPVWGVGALVWLGFVLRFAIKVVPARRQAEHQTNKDARYFQSRAR